MGYCVDCDGMEASEWHSTCSRLMIFLCVITVGEVDHYDNDGWMDKMKALCATDCE